MRAMRGYPMRDITTPYPPNQPMIWRGLADHGEASVLEAPRKRKTTTPYRRNKHKSTPNPYNVEKMALIKAQVDSALRVVVKGSTLPAVLDVTSNRVAERAKRVGLM